MPLSEARQRVDLAYTVFRRCVEQEVAEYGEQYDELRRMEDEAPAPDPCVQLFNELVDACLDYENLSGEREELELGEYRDRVYRRMEEVSRWEGEGGP
ncbi:hypothetical protein [Calidithermus chliarophilus]|uniref:hypothetical protein n=1 Tax=Calidithermus chliarophilus TaxID=52023 RepID=UPI0004132AF7|nr:hypothetical protein [Calidithermus chliarophilus]